MKPSDIDKSRLPWLKMYNPTRAFYPLDPRPEDIDIKNIAWSLSMQCRFNGHVKHFYSVAQHSVIVSRIVESEHPFDNNMILRALMHDAPEAYIGDIVTPIKKELPRYYEIESKLDEVICEVFGMNPTLPKCIMDADLVALVTESRDLHDVAFLDEMFDHIKPLDFEIEAVDQKEAYEMFLNRFENLQERIRFTEFQERQDKKKKKRGT